MIANINKTGLNPAPGLRPEPDAAPLPAIAPASGDRIALGSAGSPSLLTALHRYGTEVSVANMSVAEKVATTARAGIARAATETGGEVGAYLKDPKNDAMLAGGIAVVAGAQLIPGVDVVVDTGLAVVGAAAYAAAGPEHRENITKALGKLKDYATEVGDAKSQADLGKASKDLADGLELGGKELADALGVVAGAASVPSRMFGLAQKAQEAGGLEGVVAAGSRGAHMIGSAVREIGTDATKAIDATGRWLDEAGAGLGLGGPRLAPAGAGGVLSTTRPRELPGAGTFHEARVAEGPPRMTVQEHDALGGHAIDRHVNKSLNWLKDRLNREPDRRIVSSFDNENAADHAQNIMITQNRKAISNWLQTREPELRIQANCGTDLGHVLKRGDSSSRRSDLAEAVLVKDGSRNGYHIQSSYLLVPR